MKEKLYIALGIIGFILIMGVVGRMDYEDWLIERQHYCTMRIAWEQQAAEGVPAAERIGWPNFKDEEYDCGFEY